MHLLVSMPALGAVILWVAVLGTVHGDDYEEAYRLRERREILPLEELLRRAGIGSDMRILEIESEFEHGRSVYEVEYLDGAGRVRKVLIDAAGGEPLPEKGDD